MPMKYPRPWIVYNITNCELSGRWDTLVSQIGGLTRFNFEALKAPVPEPRVQNVWPCKWRGCPIVSSESFAIEITRSIVAFNGAKYVVLACHPSEVLPNRIGTTGSTNGCELITHTVGSV